METLHQLDEIVAQRYRIVTALGQGAFGTTYEAEDLTNYQRVAVKVLSLRQISDWKVLELLEREARVLKNLQHPAIPKYLDYFHLDSDKDRRFYLVQELVAGESLAALVAKGWHPNESEVKQICVQLLKILDYLHRLTPPVIHRDINPHNLMRRPDGRMYLVDFGAVQEVYRNTLTRGGTFVGTLGYMPPEQFSGSVNPASDLYSLGATLLFLLSKRSPAELPLRRMKLDFRRRVKISPEFADWLEKMLEPAIEDRFQSATEALRVLKGEQALLPALMPRRSQHSIVPRRRKPEKSRILLEKTNKRLVVEIPPAGWVYALMAACVFSLWNIPVWFGFWEVLQSFNLMLFLFILPFLAFSIGLLAVVLWSFAGRTRLEIDRQHFRLHWDLWNLTVRQFQGRTDDIERVELDVTVGSKGRVSTACAIWEGVYKRRLGTSEREENEWLVGEVSNFLDKLRYGKRSH